MKGTETHVKNIFLSNTRAKNAQSYFKKIQRHRPRHNINRQHENIATTIQTSLHTICTSKQ